MKFLNVYCEDRKKEVYINLDKIVLITKLDEDSCQITVDGKEAMVTVAMRPEDLVRKINGEDKVTIGFRSNR